MDEQATYEQRIIQRIAEWKSEKPSLFNRVTSRLARPFAWTLKHAIPESAARAAIGAAYSTASWLSDPGEILSKGNVSSVEELRTKSLPLSDRLAGMVSQGSQTIAAVDGAVTGAGGAVLAAADVGALGIVCLRSIHRTGQCYGYSLETPDDRGIALGILLVAGSRSKTEKLEAIGQLENVKSWVLCETLEAVAIETLAKQLIEIASLSAIPGIGAAIGTGTNLLFVRQVLKTAQCLFQERWLMHNGILNEPIPPGT